MEALISSELTFNYDIKTVQQFNIFKDSIDLLNKFSYKSRGIVEKVQMSRKFTKE